MMGSSLIRRVLGTTTERDYKRFEPEVHAVCEREGVYAAMSNDGLRRQTGLLKARLHDGESLEDVLPDAFAVVREASKRVTGMRPFDVQIFGAVVLHRGKIAEMLTGEGKTLVATMPLYLNALTGRGVHLVTVNDYLARRDSQWMGPIFEFLGLTVGLIQHGMSIPERQAAYKADITYATNNEVGFDYLKDNMAKHPDERVQRELHYAIIDEIDSILIDESRTPLIISGYPVRTTDMYYKVDEAIRKLRRESHYDVEEKGRHVMLTDEGMEMTERLLGVDNLYTEDTLGIVHMVEQALRAHNFYKKDDEYVVNNGEILIVDEFTGRIMEGRRFSDGLHQALEAKEQVPVQQETQTLASITYQNLFKLYDKLAGMTGTAMTEAMEFDQTYGLEVISIPPNLPLRRDDMTDLVFASEGGKFNYVVDEIASIHETGRPILVGTVSIEKSETLAKLLDKRGVEGHEVLNAKQHEREAAIVANAGKPGAITIATNMAGRGTDIKLGEGVAEKGGLAIIGTERHESRRIDNQLRGRAGRQGDPGTTRFYVSLEDEVARLFGGNRVKKLIDMFGGQQMDEQPLDQRMVSRSIERAQRQVEERNFEIRKHLLEYDDVMNKQRQVIYEMRRDVLEDRDVTEQLHEMFENVVVGIVDEFAPEDVVPEEWDLEGMKSAYRIVFGFEPDLSEDVSEDASALIDVLYKQVLDTYNRREAAIAEDLRADFRDQIGGDDSQVDFERLARKRVHDFEMMAILSAVDSYWTEHLHAMDYLRESVRLRAYGQRDPLLEYKKEGFEMFERLMQTIAENVAQTLFRVTDPEVLKRRALSIRKGTLTAQEDPLAHLAQYRMVGADKQQDYSFATYDTSRFELAGAPAPADSDQAVQVKDRPRAKGKTVRRAGKKIKPNDPCPCGSGKKYKKCCGANI